MGCGAEEIPVAWKVWVITVTLSQKFKGCFSKRSRYALQEKILRMQPLEVSGIVLGTSQQVVNGNSLLLGS